MSRTLKLSPTMKRILVMKLTGRVVADINLRPAIKGLVNRRLLDADEGLTSEGRRIAERITQIKDGAK